MTDRRRSRWIAADAHFYAGKLGADLRARFGPVGLLCFDAFLRACKLNNIEGQITYNGTQESFLAVVGLPFLELVDEDGDNWTLDAFWTYLGDRKQTSRRRRGRLVDVISTNWGKWQKDFRRQLDSERKGGSGGGITAEDAPEIDGESTADAPPYKDIDNDNDTPPAPQEPADGEAVEEPDVGEGEDFVGQVLDLLAEADVAAVAAKGPVHSPAGLKRKKRRDRLADVPRIEEVHQLNPAASARTVADIVLTTTESALDATARAFRAHVERQKNPCQRCEGHDVVPNHAGDYVPCPACNGCAPNLSVVS